MELIFSSFPLIFTFFLFFFMLLKSRKRPQFPSPSNLPPGPRKLPIIGNIHQLRGRLPHRTLRDLAKKYGPLMHLQLGEVSTIVVSSPEMAKEVMKTNDIKFATRPELLVAKVIGYNCSNISFAPYNDYWRQLRKLCAMELFSSNRIRSFQPVREEEVQNLVNHISLKAGSSINLSENIFATSYTIASRVTFGKKHKDLQRFETLVKQGLSLVAGANLSDLYPSVKLLYVMSGMRARLLKLRVEADKIIEDILDEHRKRVDEMGEKEVDDYEDLVDVLLKYERKGSIGFHLTTNNIKAVITDLFSGVGETSASTVNWAMSEMMKNPRVMEKAQAEVRQIGCIGETTYLKLVIKETLRLHPPGPLLLPRECRTNCEINGFDIPSKTRVIVNAWAIGRDPRHWAAPETFYPERFLDSSIDFKGTNFEFIPFGAGRRICPGMDSGLASVELFLSYLLYHFDWKLPDGVNHEDLDMIETFGVASRRRDDLWVVPIPYNRESLQCNRDTTSAISPLIKMMPPN